jgi:hypothetical protein
MEKEKNAPARGIVKTKENLGHKLIYKSAHCFPDKM